MFLKTKGCTVRLQTLLIFRGSQEVLLVVWKQFSIAGSRACGPVPGQEQSTWEEYCRDLSGLERRDQPGLLQQTNLSQEPGKTMRSTVV